jgi:hypothetical protein
MKSNDDLIGALTINEFIENFRIGRTSTYRLINEGKLRAVKASKKTLILKKDAEAWAQSLPAFATCLTGTDLVSGSRASECCDPPKLLKGAVRS